MHRLGLLAAPLLLSLLPACHRPPPVVELVGPTMGTTYSIKVRHLPPALSPTTLHTQIDRRLDAIEQTMSTYRPGSELSRFNSHHDTRWHPASTELVHIIRTALEISARSGGAFDVTVGPLVNLWGFGPGIGDDEPPGEDAIRQALRSVGYHHLHVREDPPAIRKDVPGLYVDLSGIAKGYGVDVVAGLLQDLGLSDFLVEIGGELRGQGHSERGGSWRIGIERPDDTRRTAYLVIPLEAMTVATSGDYRNFYESTGRRYSHTIDPRSGWPVTHGLASVTVVHPSATRADAWATALMVLGLEAGLDLARRAGLAAFFIQRDPQGGFSTAGSPAFEQIVPPGVQGEGS